MRVPFALALLTLLAAGLAPARAADLVEPPDGAAWPGDRYSEGGQTFGVRASPVVIYDYESGTGIRHYWLAPWHDRHYFPVSGKAPRLGRVENLSAVGGVHRRAETFSRYWSTAELFDRAPWPAQKNPPRKIPQPPVHP